MITLGSDLASKVYKQLDDKLTEKLALEISNISNISNTFLIPFVARSIA